MINLSTLQGYLGDEGLSANYFDADGFAKTGDVGYYDSRGRIFLEGRMNDMIRLGSRK